MADFDKIFLSTLSLRRATYTAVTCMCTTQHFYPRSPCGERRHSRLPSIPNAYISIHALLAESDVGIFGNKPYHENFYPRSPCGERPSRLHKNICGWGFLSTLSLRRATPVPQGVQITNTISIHALLAESDVSCNYFPFDIAISIHALLAESDHPDAGGI